MKRFWILLPGLLVGLTAVGFAMGRTRGISTLAAALISAPLREPRASIVKVVKTEQGYALERDGQPYFIKGIGGNHYLETAKRAGANSVRTWGADNLESLLDHAQAQGLTVTIGIWLGQERQGFHYDNPQSVAQQFAQARDAIRRYRNHPVLLM